MAAPAPAPMPAPSPSPSPAPVMMHVEMAPSPMPMHAPMPAPTPPSQNRLAPMSGNSIVASPASTATPAGYQGVAVDSPGVPEPEPSVQVAGTSATGATTAAPAVSAPPAPAATGRRGSGAHKVTVHQRDPMETMRPEVVGKTRMRHFPNSYNPDYRTPYWVNDGGFNFDQPTVAAGQTRPPSDPGASCCTSSSVKKRKWHNLCTVIPFFNEEKHELIASLEGLWWQSQKILAMKQRLQVLLILDGWAKASKSMKEYLLAMFPPQAGEPAWREHITPIEVGREQECIDTFIVQSVGRDEKGQEVNCAVRINPGEAVPKWLRVSLLIKRDNRRKHNSHMWFLASFAPFYNSRYVFLTDCGTMYDHECLPELVKYLDDNRTCTAVTGKQRCMSYRQQCRGEQGLLEPVEGEGFFKDMYRRAQRNDYEMSTSAYNPAFSAVGVLPVVPGPCGLFRFNALYDSYARLIRRLTELEHAQGEFDLELTDINRQQHKLDELSAANNKALSREYEASRVFTPEQLSMFLSQQGIAPQVAQAAALAAGRESKYSAAQVARDAAAASEAAIMDSPAGQAPPIPSSGLMPPSAMAGARETKKGKSVQHAMGGAIIFGANESKEAPVPSNFENLPAALQSENYLADTEKINVALRKEEAKTRAKEDSEDMARCVVIQKKLRERARVLDDLKTHIEAAKVHDSRQQLRLTEIKEKTDINKPKKSLSDLQRRSGKILAMLWAPELNSSMEASREYYLGIQMLRRRSRELQIELEELVERRDLEGQQVKLRRDAMLPHLREQKHRALLERRNRRRERAQLEKQRAAEETRKRAAEYTKKLESYDDDAIDFYHKYVNVKPEDTDLATGSLLLAEDRILSLAAVFKTNISGAYTGYNPRAVFYFQAEVEEAKFASQRRRWINGTIAGYIWLVGETGMILKSKHISLFRSIPFLFLVLLQIMMYAITSVAPGLFATSFHFACREAFPGQTTYNDWFLILYAIMYTTFVILHAQTTGAAVRTWLFRLVTIVNVLVELVVLAYLIVQLAEGSWTDGFSMWYHNENIWSADSIRSMSIVLVLANTILPYILNWMSGWRHLWHMLQYPLDPILFMLYLPTMVGYISAYAFARIWDLSWGNRDSGSMVTMASLSDAAAQQAKRNETHAKANFYCSFVLVLNLSIMVFLSYPMPPLLLLIIAALAFVPALFQMIISFFWLLGRMTLSMMSKGWNLLLCRCNQVNALPINARELKAMRDREALPIYKSPPGSSCPAQCVTGCCS